MRKRKWLAGVAALVLPAALAAQADVGVKGGLSFGNISNKGVLPGNLDTRTGFAIGLYLGTGGVLGIGAEGLYAQRGLESDVASTTESKLDFIDVPVYLKVKLPIPAIKPFI